MIKVTVKESVLGDKGYETKLITKEHPNGGKASVFNGVLTVFTETAQSNDFSHAIAGYEPSAWSSWEKA